MQENKAEPIQVWVQIGTDAHLFRVQGSDYVSEFRDLIYSHFVGKGVSMGSFLDWRLANATGELLDPKRPLADVLLVPNDKNQYSVSLKQVVGIRAKPVNAPRLEAADNTHFRASVGRVFKLYKEAGRYGCCGTAVAIDRSRLLTTRHSFEAKEEEEEYRDIIVVYIAGVLLRATIQKRSRGFGVVVLVLDEPCDLLVPLPMLTTCTPQHAQVVLVHYPLLHDNSIFISSVVNWKALGDDQKLGDQKKFEVKKFGIERHLFLFPRRQRSGKPCAQSRDRRSFLPGAWSSFC